MLPEIETVQHNALLAIQRIMSSREWSADTLDEVRDVMNAAGYAIADDDDDGTADDQAGGCLPDLISSDQASAWAGRPLTAEDLERLDACIPNSSIPEAIGDIVEGWR